MCDPRTKPSWLQGPECVPTGVSVPAVFILDMSIEVSTTQPALLVLHNALEALWLYLHNMLTCSQDYGAMEYIYIYISSSPDKTRIIEHILKYICTCCTLGGPGEEEKEGSVMVEFDDGDRGRISLANIRLLPPGYQIHCEYVFSNKGNTQESQNAWKSTLYRRFSFRCWALSSTSLTWSPWQTKLHPGKEKHAYREASNWRSSREVPRKKTRWDVLYHHLFKSVCLQYLNAGSINPLALLPLSK